MLKDTPRNLCARSSTPSVHFVQFDSYHPVGMCRSLHAHMKQTQRLFHKQLITGMLVLFVDISPSCVCAGSCKPVCLQHNESLKQHAHRGHSYYRNKIWGSYANLNQDTDHDFAPLHFPNSFVHSQFYVLVRWSNLAHKSVDMASHPVDGIISLLDLCAR